jgi:hypothetical protein
MLKEQNHFKPDNELLKHGQTGWCLGFAMKPTKYGMTYLHTGNNAGFRSFCSFNIAEALFILLLQIINIYACRIPYYSYMILRISH